MLRREAMQPLHTLEKRVLRALEKIGEVDIEGLSRASNLTLDQVRRAVEWLQAKGLIKVEVSQKTVFTLGSKGLEALEEGLPERRLLRFLKEGLRDLNQLKSRFRDGQEFSAALGRARRRGWVKIVGDSVELVNEPGRLPEEEALERLAQVNVLSEEDVSKDGLLHSGFKELLSRPDYLSKRVVKATKIALTDLGRAALEKISEEEEIDALTPEIIASGVWRQKRIRAIDVEAPAPPIYAGRKHPVQLFIDEVREIFISMGFEEIEGPLIQPCFWNFDALFTPQDHPAREMQDTFYIRGEATNYADAETVRRVSATHRDGWKTGSRGWGYEWREEEARKLVLRTHTTSVTIRYLADYRPKEARVFTVGRVFRNEKVTFKNLVEFHQIEGIAVGPRLTLRDLMGLLSTFYRRLGLERVKFWPTYFPYTEPSMQSVVYYDRAGRWIELCGMGIFRPEVTLPFGVKNPVLAWGGGLERLVMMRYNIDDVRELYANRLSWLRGESDLPVVTIYYDRLRKMLNAEDIEPYIERLPYLGLDIEEEAQDHIKVEYNPNRPDFSTDYGIVRALKGLLGLEKGCPKYSVQKSDLVVQVDKSVEGVRPYIVSALIEGVTLDDETIRQIIAMQEDLHHTIGRRRAKVSIGIHNFDVLKPPIIYTTEAPDFRFVPLGGVEPLSMREILEKTPVGQRYGWIVAKHKRYPILIDSLGQVLSFPPIINGELTRVTQATRNLFLDVTATDLKAAEDALAILVTTLADAGGVIRSVEVHYPNLVLTTPNLSEAEMCVELKKVNRLLGLKLRGEEAVECLARSRIDAEYDGGVIRAKIPRYRVDIMHPIDLVEEVAIGYGLDRLTPTLPSTKTVGRPHPELKRLSAIREVCVGLGLTEVMNLSLTSEAALYTNLGRGAQDAIKVEEAKSSEHEYLRDMLIPSLLLNLATNIHEPYPQRLFEVAKTFRRRGGEIAEEYHLAVITSHSEANYTEAKSLLDAITQQAFGTRCETKPSTNPLFIQGRCAEVKGGRLEGVIGEIRPEVLQAFNLRMPAAALELNIEQAIKPEGKQHK